MNPTATLLATALAASMPVALTAQSPLSMFDANNTLGVPAQVFFDLTVNSDITVHALDVHLNGGGTGAIEIRVANAPLTTYIGSEFAASSWTLVSGGNVTSNGFGEPTPVCLTTPWTLTAGQYAVAINYVGVTPLYAGNNAAPPTPVANTELTLTPGAVQQNPFASGALFTPRRFSGSFYYFPGTSLPAGVTCGVQTAENVSYGEGCYRVEESFYTFDDETAAAALSGNSLSLLPNAPTQSYVPLYGTGLPYLPPTGAATTLTGFLTGGLINDDDGDLQVTLPQPFTLADGSQVTTLFVHSNGMVSTGSNEDFINTNNAALFGVAPPAAGQSYSWAPWDVTSLDLPNEAWGMWHDYNITEPGSGAIKTELFGNLFTVTWDGVESYPDTAPNPSTLQLQFELGTGGAPGAVHYVFDNITPIGIAGGLAWADVHNFFYSPGGQSINHGVSDITAFDGSKVLGPDDLPLTLSTDTRPVIGSTMRYQTTNEPSPGIGAHIVSLAPVAGVDPFTFGLTPMPGCEALVDINQGLALLIASGSAFLDFPFPANPALAGTVIYNQSVWVNVAGAGPLLLELSNGIESTVGID